MATIVVLVVFALFLGAILTGGYNKELNNRLRSHWLWDWITTTDHKKIAVLYMLGGTFFFVIGGIEALLMRTRAVVS